MFKDSYVFKYVQKIVKVWTIIISVIGTPASKTYY